VRCAYHPHLLFMKFRIPLVVTAAALVTLAASLLHAAEGPEAKKDPLEIGPFGIGSCHTNSRSAIIGGVVYHSSRVPQLKDAYIYGDEGSSEIFMLRNTGMTVTQNAVLFLDTGSRPSCFGFDPSNGDVLYAALRSGNNSIMKRIVSTVPSINTVELSDTNLIASGAGGNFGGTYTLLSSFDLTLPSSSWTPLATNSFDGLGNFSFTIPISLDDTQTFFKVRMP